VHRFVDFFLKNADSLVREVNYVSLGAEAYRSAAEKFAKELAQ
jgi:hypothetical protein